MRFVFWSVLGLLAACNTVSSSGPELNVVLDDAAGLRGGAPVYVAGVQVGRVHSVRLEGQRARITFQLSPDANVTLHRDACVSVGYYGISNEAHLKLDLGTTASPVLERGELTCTRSNSKDSQRMLESMQTILTAATSGEGTIARLLNDKKLADKVERYFERAAAETEPARSAEPTPSAAPAPSASPAPPSKSTGPATKKSDILDGRR